MAMPFQILELIANSLNAVSGLYVFSADRKRPLKFAGKMKRSLDTTQSRYIPDAGICKTAIWRKVYFSNYGA